VGDLDVVPAPRLVGIDAVVRDVRHAEPGSPLEVAELVGKLTLVAPGPVLKPVPRNRVASVGLGLVLPVAPEELDSARA